MEVGTREKFTDHEGFSRRGGLRWWGTKRLSLDGLRITVVDGRFVKGEFYDLRSERIEPFTIDLETGASEGGVEHT